MHTSTASMVDLGFAARRASAAALLIALTPPLAAQLPTWETAANHPGDPKYVQMPYEVAFVATKVVETPPQIGETSCGPGLLFGRYQIGTDVGDATKPSAGNSLWVVTRNGDVKKLFPLPVHETLMVPHPVTGLPVRLINTPLGQLDKGSVVEPNVSEDGRRIIFAYFHDATNNVSAGEGGMSRAGADLFTLDVSPLAIDPYADPATFTVRRLTFKDFNPDGSQTSADKNKDAMNPSVVNLGNNGWGTVEMHGVEMRTADGLKLVWVSGEKRLLNSNENYGHPNYNLNLNIADLNADGSLGVKRQFHYYTTTSALSPAPLPNGIAFSYQATTADGRNWQIQRIDSAGRWAPLIGYGSNDDLFHLGAYCVATASYNGDPAGDFFIATRYYNLNNNGFGGLWKINLAETGINTYNDATQWGVKPKQKSARRLAPLVTDNDYPSGKNAQGQFYGKMTAPRCGRPDELLFAYSPTSANGRLCASDGKDIYHAFIAFRDGFATFDPTAVWSPANNVGLRILVDDSAEAYTLAWPVPILSWQERTGQVQQAFSNPVIDRRSPVLPGQPYAQVGTSSIYNTDRRPYDCWLGAGGGGQPYNPNLKPSNQPPGALGVDGNQIVQILQSFDGVTKVLQTGGVPDFCKALSKADVLGIQVNITNNKINHDCCNLGYETDGSARLETARQLGVYDVRGQGDGSFKAMIPAHVPFEFHLLDSQYGMRLVDVRSWHSLQPRETRTNCGGCHQHVEGLGEGFKDTEADLEAPLDMVTQTQVVNYDAFCNPTLVTLPTATEALPEWKADIWPGFQAHCGSCHTGSGSGTAAFSFSDEQTAYNVLRFKNFADTISGALGSPAFWAARGERTDGRNNALYAATNPPYKFSAIHATNPALCTQGDATKAAWVQKLGQWIDNHMPRDVGGNFPAKKDTYHPTVDSAYSNNLCDGTKLRVGYWDDSGFLKLVQVSKNGAVLASWGPNQPNGSQILTGLAIANADVIKVLAEDADGNRQFYEKAGRQLKADCQWKFLLVQPLPVTPP